SAAGGAGGGPVERAGPVAGLPGHVFQSGDLRWTRRCPGRSGSDCDQTSRVQGRGRCFSMTAGVMVALLCLAAGPQDEAAADLAAVIDRRLEERAREAQIPLAPRADDAEFFRRLTIDLRGHIPAADEVQRFLEDEAPDKRSRAIRSAL